MKQGKTEIKDILSDKFYERFAKLYVGRDAEDEVPIDVLVEEVRSKNKENGLRD